MVCNADGPFAVQSLCNRDAATLKAVQLLYDRTAVGAHFSVARRVYFPRRGAIRFAEDEHGQLCHFVQLGRFQHLVIQSVRRVWLGRARWRRYALNPVRIQARVIESSAEVRVTILKEADIAVIQARINFHVSFGDGAIRFRVANLQSAEVLRKSLCALE